MALTLENKNVGDEVWIDGYTSMAQQNFGKRIITGIDYRFDETTGEKYKIIQIDNDWYDSRDGGCYSNKDSMYYITK